jgi:hypothetical protein
MNDAESGHHKKDKRWYHEITLWSCLNFIFWVSIFSMAIAILVQQSHLSSATSLMQSRMTTLGRGTPNGRTLSVASQLALDVPVLTRMCEEQMYYAARGTANDTLHKLKATIDDITGEPLASYYHYAVSAAVDIEVGADVARQLETATKAMFKLNSEVKYMSFAYNVTTDYPFFSSIRLQELEFNPFEHAWRNARQIVLCSNSAAVSSLRCDRHGDEKIITVHNTKWRPVVPGAPVTEKKPAVPDSRVRTAQPKPRTQSADSEEELFDLIESPDSSPTRIDAQKDEIMGKRLYNVVFYRLVASPGDRVYQSHQMGSGGVQQPREEKILTLELSRC